MSGGLAALLDDIAALAKVAAASIDDVGMAAGRASAKAAGVVVDDTAVTPRYVHGFAAKREVPIIMKIARGSLLNKLILIIGILVLSYFVPWILTPLLMVGGLYLCFEGAEKLWERFNPHHEEQEVPVAMQGEDHEKTMVAGAIRTDFILSAEIMVISYNEVRAEPLVTRGIILLVVALLITLLVYGVVALIVKMDDVGLALAQRESPAAKKFGKGLVRAMPKVLAVLSTVGIIAMLWVGGHILLVGLDELSTMLNVSWLHAPYGFVHHLEELAAHATGPVGGLVVWLVNTFFSFLFGLIVGAIVVAIMHVLPIGKKHGADDSHASASTTASGPATGSENQPSH
ncbi:MAG TPA: DUF808 domain-containing protein [Propionibacteriaceae bacterium]|nr:DUF808 domain-containing protein [Propionibacteriaceae bacterium]